MPVAARPAVDRFMDLALCELNTGHWLWLGYIKPNGYGQFTLRRNVSGYAHRFAYETFVGPIPDGYVIDHLCRTPSCVNPSHLRAVPQSVNVRAGRGHGSETSCHRGHPFDEANTRTHVTARGVARHCRVCHREREAQRRAVVRRAC